MLGFSVFMAVSYLTGEIGFRYFNLSVANNIFWGFFGALVIASPFFLRNQKARKNISLCLKSHAWLLVSITVIISFSSILWFLVLSKSNSGIMALLDKSEVLWTILLGIFFLKEKFRKKECYGIILSIIGLVLISTLEGEINYYLSFLVLLTAFFYALQSFLVKKFASEMDSFAFTFLRGIGLLIIIGSFFGIQGQISFIGMKEIALVGFGQFCGLLIARVFYFEAHKFLDISKLNIFQLSVPVFVLLGQYFLFPETTFSQQKILGAILILGGMTFFVYQHKELKTSSELK